MSNSGTPAGWYPDPENPGQSRYWDGTAWAAPTAATTMGAAPGGGSGGNKTPLIVIAIIAVVALIGGGAYFLLSGDDDNDDDERVATDDDDDDDGGGRSSGPSASPSDVEELSESDFLDWASDRCSDLEGDLEDISELYFGGIPSSELDDLPNSVLSAFESDMLDLTDSFFSEMRTAGPEGDVDEWLDLLDDWQDVYLNIIDGIAGGNFDAPLQYSSDLEKIGDRADDFGLSCLNGGSMGTGESSPGGSSSDPEPGDDPGGSSSAGDPTPPPSFDNAEFAGLAEDCYEGDLGACDDLYFKSPFGSDEEEYGDTCGGRTDGGTLCVLLDD